MKKLYLIFLFDLAILSLSAQTDTLTKTKIVIGLSAPELLHLGINVDLSKWNQLGISAGVGPSWGQAWPTLSLEQRFYFGNIGELTNRRKWFFRQSGTWFPAGKEGAGTLTLGIDFKSKHPNRGWTIDAGVFDLFRNRRDYKNLLYPALRFQYYSYFKKSKAALKIHLLLIS